jgi:2-C-methyl-D-erythritol 4-phosphate cytidylyltransferase
MVFNVGVLIVCAGRGRRLGGIDKAVLKLKQKPLFYHSFRVFREIKEIKQIVIVLRRNNFNLAKKIIRDKKVLFAEGGRERKDSVFNGLSLLSKEIDYVLIHDGARPFISKRMILNILRKLKKYPAVICAIRAADTLKLTEKGYIRKTLDRQNIFLAQTPQGFRRDLITKGYKKFKNKKLTDDAQFLELMGKKVKIIDGSRNNIKITYPEDILLAKALLKQRIVSRV